MAKKYLTSITLILFAVATLFGQTNKNIPFKIAKNYFVNNTFKNGELKSLKILTAEKFAQYIGMATVMGIDGKPTDIDFTKQFVIVVINDLTNNSTTLIPEKLELIGKNHLNFTFKTIIGEETTATFRPFTMIIVDKKYRKSKIELTTYSVL